MTEEEARRWIVGRFGVSRETLLDRFETLLRGEAERQNLISAASFPELWARHFVDSAQLILAATDGMPGAWLDVGTGAGMPGLVVGILSDRPMILVEPRGRRAEFLASVVAEFDLAARITVETCKIERYRPTRPVAIVSARAVAPLPGLLRSTYHCTDSSTIWLLPKGRAAQSEVEAARVNWQGSFHVEPSITQAESGIVIARGIRPR
jgi:16S rRNA (guanine527-N7)-methyltransferase